MVSNIDEPTLYAPEAESPELAVAEPAALADPHDAAMEALRQIRDILDQFPLEWQIGIVKALTARAIVMTQDRLHPTPPVLSA